MLRKMIKLLQIKFITKRLQISMIMNMIDVIQQHNK